ncbi:GNAT family N-acetyltransferase [Chryseolinea lacunae]|uniref:GNAT family N-acetyltransferase n=1 Tax=Chryseolinea lacunae TaxID=2801331 RepID=A0ABS1KYZ6_9BACT|nr:GNAT family N-acetyltransferase [Chryseolinea lacunae]MBL0744691.1 GNAT family N-acetyltransferase [Chryseolinea lacunae]
MKNPGLLTIKQVAPTDAGVVALIDKLNRYQIALYGIEACNLEPPESLIKNNAFMVGAFSHEELAGIGAIKVLDGYGEIKRMYVEESHRGLSVAEEILSALETYAAGRAIHSVYLETGRLHHAAIKFYRKMGYEVVEQFGDYRPNAVSLYFGKTLTGNAR